MAQPLRPRALGPDAEHRLAVRKLFMAVHGFVWRVLQHYRVPPADRDDLAQDVVIKALRSWRNYRAESGTPGQWLWGIARNQVRTYLRERGKQPVLVDHDLLDRQSEVPIPEESVSSQRLADRFLARLPTRQRRVVLLYEVAGCTYREIAALEGISKSDAERQHKAGMQALAAAVEQFKGEGAVVSLMLAGLLAGDEGGPPVEATELAWERVVQEGLADTEGTPPESGPRLREPGDHNSPGSHPSPGRFADVKLLGGGAAVLLAGLLAGARLGAGCGRAQQTALLVPAAPSAAPVDTAEEKPTPSGIVSAPEPPIRMAPGAPGHPVTPVAASIARTAFDDDRRFPNGQNAAARERLWSEACARRRLAPVGGGAVVARCGQ
jgi:RNA polymerase sigma factor (sigma-70 family)